MIFIYFMAGFLTAFGIALAIDTYLQARQRPHNAFLDDKDDWDWDAWS